MSGRCVVVEGTSARAGAPLKVRRVPLYLTSQGEPLFAWLHMPERFCRRAALLCAPLGHEQIHAHRTLRHLADALAQAGLAALRFDYHGTGDSAGFDESPERRATWLANIRSALRWLHDELGCVDVSGVGLRLGATLLCEAAAEDAVQDLVLWALVIKGRAYVREMKALSLAGGTPAGQIDAAGFVMAEQTATELGRIDLLQIKPRCQRALIVSRDDLPVDTTLRERFASLGIATEQATRPGYAAMLAEPHLTEVPYLAIAEIVAWLGTRGARDCAEPTLAMTGPTVAKIALGVSEQAVRIATEPDLFGILTTPVLPREPARPTVVLVNAGAAHHVGPNRLHVQIARRLAEDGFPCLRMDLRDLGDSVGADAMHENETYPATAFRDIELAFEFLKREHSVDRVVLMGLCSGAYVAFQSAAQFEEPALIGSALLNPLTFFWKEGMTVESAQSVQFQAYDETISAALRPQKWLKLLSGRSKRGITGAFRILLERWRLRRHARAEAMACELNPPTGTPTHPARNDLPGDLARITAAGRWLSFFFAPTDPGRAILDFYARRPVATMSAAGQLRLQCIPDADHTFSRQGPRAALIEALVADLNRRLESTRRDPRGILQR